MVYFSIIFEVFENEYFILTISGSSLSLIQYILAFAHRTHSSSADFLWTIQSLSFD